MFQPPIKLIVLRPLSSGVLRVELELCSPDDVEVLNEETVPPYFGDTGLRLQGHGCVTTLLVKARTSRMTKGESN